MHLKAEHLQFSYISQQTVLHDVSLEVHSGETLYLLGRNGSGKSTLLACLAGLLKPEAGAIRIDGNEINAIMPAERARLIGLIPQLHIPVFSYTVAQMVMLGRAPHFGWLSTPSRQDHEIVAEAMAQVGLHEMRDRPYTSLSGGEQQLTLIARGLAQKSPILLMDEPTAHLDLSNQHRVLEIVQQLSEQGLSFIVSSHSPNNALAYADRVLLLTGGWVTACGSPAEILTESLLSTVYGIRTQVIRDHDQPVAIVTQRPIRLLPDSLKDPNSLLRDIFSRGKTTPQLILVTGLSGVGKTTWCARLIDLARASGLSVSGVLSPSLLDQERKIGIQVLNLSTGESRQLATLRTAEDKVLSTPRWTFNETTLEWANEALARAGDSDLLVIDELGPLEFFKNQGLTAGLKRLDAGQYQVAVAVIRSSLLPNALQRWPNAIVVNGGWQAS